MVQVATRMPPDHTGREARPLKRQLVRQLVRAAIAIVAASLLFSWCTAKVAPNELGVEQRRFGSHVGIVDHVYGPGRYFLGVGETMHTFPREIHLLEADERDDALAKASTSDVRAKVEKYFERRQEILGRTTDRVIEPLNIQTSDGYAVLADVTLLYSIVDPVKVARDFGWGTTYVDAFVVNTFRNGVLTTMGKMNAESFYDEKIRIRHVAEAEAFMRERFRERGFQVERLLLRSYRYVPAYEKSLHDKKVAVQLAVKNEKERLVNEEKAKLERIEGQGNARITIAESEIDAQIAKIKAESDLYWAEVHARGDRE